jgi:hypothetical protein
VSAALKPDKNVNNANLLNRLAEGRKNTEYVPYAKKEVTTRGLVGYPILRKRPLEKKDILLEDAHIVG